MPIRYDDKRDVIVKRLPVFIDAFEHIQRYDWDNLYPERCNELVNRAYTLNSIINTAGDFLYGEGFEDTILGNMVVNSDHLYNTLNDVLNNTRENVAKFKTICLHVNYDLNYKICSIRSIEFDRLRLGYPDKDGVVKKIAYSTNWPQEFRKEPDGNRRVYEYDIFNPDPNVVAQQIMDCGGIYNYKGQILYFTPKPFIYPKATFDPVFDQAQTQAELAMYKLASVQNKFNATLAILYPGEFQTPEEEARFNNLIDSKTGSRQAGSAIGLQDHEGNKKAGDVFVPITPVNVDKMYELTERICVDAIIENEAIPKSLIGIHQQGVVFSKENIENDYIYYNARTRKRRAEISRVFRYVLSFWHDPTVLNLDTKIKELFYGVDPGSAGTPGVANEAVKSLTGRQSQNLRRIQRQFDKGTLPKERAIAELKIAFGVTDEQAAALLDDDTSNDPI